MPDPSIPTNGHTHKCHVPDVETVLSDPSASYWLKNALQAALGRDIVDAANDAEVLFSILRHRAEQ